MSIQTMAAVGLGSMGFGMARSLLAAGHTVYGFDVSQDAVARFVDAGGLAAPMPDVAPIVDVLVSVVLSAEQTDAVLLATPAGPMPCVEARR